MIFHCYKVYIDERTEAAISAKKDHYITLPGFFLGIISKPLKTSHDLVKAIFLKHSTGCSQSLRFAPDHYPLAQLEELPCFGQTFTKTCLRRFQLVFLGFDDVCAPIWDIFRSLRTRNTGEGIQHHNRDALRPANPILCYLSPCSLYIVLARQLCVSFQIIFFLLLHALRHAIRRCAQLTSCLALNWHCEETRVVPLYFI